MKVLFVLPRSLSAKSDIEGDLAKYAPEALEWDICQVNSASHLFQTLKAEFSGLVYDWVVVIDRPVRLAKHGLSALIAFLGASEGEEVVYADSTINSSHGHMNARPDFSPERLRSQNYLGPLVAYRPNIALKAARQPERHQDIAAYALSLSATRQASSVGHLRAPAYVEIEKASPLEAAARADLALLVEEHLKVTGGGIVHNVDEFGLINSTRAVQGEPLVSIVIPTMGIMNKANGTSQSYVIDAVHSIMDVTTYRNFEIVLVVDSIADPSVIEKLEEIAGLHLRIVNWTKPFNFSEKMNFGVMHALGEFVLLLNDDVRVISPMWLEAMLGLAQLPNAGMVGAMLYYDDDTIQHAGHAYYQGSPTHIGLGLPRGSKGPNSAFLVEREVSGVTAACALMPMEVFKAAGGFTALLPGNFNDVDLCMKVGWLNYDIYWTPAAELYHFESKTRDAHVHYYELDVIEHRWGLKLDDSRFWRGHPWAAN